LSEPIKKKILLISYHFPPSTEVGGLRVANFAKYLPALGWDTYVLTIKECYLEKVDNGRLDGIDAERIFRTDKLPTVSGAYLTLKKIYYGLFMKKPHMAEKSDGADVQPAGNRSSTETLSGKLKRYILSFLMIPDEKRNWILPALFKAVREIRRNNIDCILTSCPPYSVHIIGLLTKMITGVKWVADYRDPWSMGGPKRNFATCALSMRIEQWLERNVVRRADIVLMNTEWIRSFYEQSFKDQRAGKFLYCPNGFDKDIFEKVSQLKKYEKFTITYAGTLYLGRTPESVFKAMQELVSEGKISLQDVCVKLVGDCRYVDGQPIAGMIRKYNLDGAVEISDPVPYAQALAIIKQSHVALLLAPNQSFQIPAKVFDYMGCGTQILTLAEDGATSDLIRSSGAGSVIHPSDVKGIKEFIYRSMNNKDLLMHNDSEDGLDKFDQKAIIQGLAEHLNRM